MIPFFTYERYDKRSDEKSRSVEVLQRDPVAGSQMLRGMNGNGLKMASEQREGTGLAATLRWDRPLQRRGVDGT